MKIESIHVTRLSNASHLQFMTDIDRTLTEAGISVEGLDIVELYSAFKPLLSQEKESYRQESGSVFTRQITESDDYRDKLYNGLAMVIEGHSYHYNNEIIKSAETIERILKQYGNPVKLPYNDETTVLNSIIADFETKLAGDIANLGLSQWVSNLKEANADFANLMMSRTNDFAIRNAVPMKEVRQSIDIIYRKITERINALIIIKGETQLASVVNTLNEQITYYRNGLAIKSGKAAANKVVDDALQQTIRMIVISVEMRFIASIIISVETRLIASLQSNTDLQLQIIKLL